MKSKTLVIFMKDFHEIMDNESKYKSMINDIIINNKTFPKDNSLLSKAKELLECKWDKLTILPNET